MKRHRKTILLVVSLTFALFASSLSAPRAAAAEKTIPLFGDRDAGWGFSNTTVTSPGPLIEVEVGDNVTLNLTSLDGRMHNWFIDYDGNNASGPGEPKSPNFGDNREYTFIVSNVTGTFHYRSDRGTDGALMWGNITIREASGGFLPIIGGDPTIVIIGIVAIAVAALAVAAMYARRKKTPPPPEP